jgi:DNA-binding NarL/FixJ family response regulator
METKTITALLIEDNPDDAVLIQRYLTGSPRVTYRVTHVDRLAAGLEILNSVHFDVILLDLGLPDGPAGIKTFEMAYAHTSSIPIIVLTGHDDDNIAIESVQRGAQDYIVKGQVTGSMLGRSIQYAIERKKLVTQLENSAREINKLRGILPICASCKKIRDDKGYWTQVEVYISDHSETEFTHGICPECAAKIYPKFFKKDGEKP